MRKRNLVIWLALVAMPAFAGVADTLEDLVGYTIVASKTIDGWQDAGGKKGDSFEGCEYGRTIIFADNKILHCAIYNYQYSYRPTAVILSNGSQFKMIVDDEVYDMQR